MPKPRSLSRIESWGLREAHYKPIPSQFLETQRCAATSPSGTADVGCADQLNCKHSRFITPFTTAISHCSAGRQRWCRSHGARHFSRPPPRSRPCLSHEAATERYPTSVALSPIQTRPPLNFSAGEADVRDIHWNSLTPDSPVSDVQRPACFDDGARRETQRQHAAQHLGWR